MEKNNSVLVKRNTIVLGSTVIQISNISSISGFKLSSEYYKKTAKILKFPGVFTAIKIYFTSSFFVFSGLFIDYMEDIAPSSVEELFINFIIISVFLSIVIYFAWFFIWMFAYFYSISGKGEYALAIETNSGNKNLIISKEVETLKRMFVAIRDFMEEPGNEPIYFDFRQDRSVRIEGGVRGSVNSGDISL